MGNYTLTIAMGKIQRVLPVKLIIGEIFTSKDVCEAGESRLKNLYGAIDLETEVLAFDFTNYYEEEMGANLLRKWVSFEKLVEPEQLAEIKCATNGIEPEISKSSKDRKINLDPGYISAPNLILASTKNYSHRIYLQKGIYAELALIYQDKQYNFLPWTYPDYKSETATVFFKKVRERYLKQLKNSE